jgi:hypothetical protein
VEVDPSEPRCPECFEPIDPESVARAELARGRSGVLLVCPNCAEHLVLDGDIGRPDIARHPSARELGRARPPTDRNGRRPPA